MTLKTKLEKIISETENELTKRVAQEILDNSYGSEDAEIKSFLSDLAQHGCVSGMISGLIYYTDTYAFYTEFASEIDDLKFEMEDNLGEPLKTEGDTRNWLAWFGYEETARKIADEIGLEL